MASEEGGVGATMLDSVGLPYQLAIPPCKEGLRGGKDWCPGWGGAGGIRPLPGPGFTQDAWCFGDASLRIPPWSGPFAPTLATRTPHDDIKRGATPPMQAAGPRKNWSREGFVIRPLAEGSRRAFSCWIRGGAQLGVRRQLGCEESRIGGGVLCRRMPPGIRLCEIFGAIFLAQASRCDEKPVVDFAVRFESQRQVAVWSYRDQTSMGRCLAGFTTHTSTSFIGIHMGVRVEALS